MSLLPGQCVWSVFFNPGLSGHRVQRGYSASPGEKQIPLSKNPFRAFLKNKAKSSTGYSVKKMCFERKIIFHFSYMYVGKDSEWGGKKGFKILYSEF